MAANQILAGQTLERQAAGTTMIHMLNMAHTANQLLNSSHTQATRLHDDKCAFFVSRLHEIDKNVDKKFKQILNMEYIQPHSPVPFSSLERAILKMP